MVNDDDGHAGESITANITEALNPSRIITARPHIGDPVADNGIVLVILHGHYVWEQPTRQGHVTLACTFKDLCQLTAALATSIRDMSDTLKIGVETDDGIRTIGD